MKKFILLMLLSFTLLAQQYSVVKIIDGDTIRVSTQDGNVTKIRFADVDTPETFTFSYKAKGDIKKCGVSTISMGKMASAKLKEVLKVGDKVDLVFNGASSHDRDVAIVYLQKENINARMVIDGYAIVWHRGRDITDLVYKKSLLDNQTDALTKTNGLWKTYPKEMECLEEYHK